MARTPQFSTSMNRRQFLKLSGGGLVAIVGANFLNGCSPAAMAPTSAPQPTTPPQPVATTPPIAAPTVKVGGTVDFLSWEGYDLPTCMADWNKAHSVTFSSSYIGDHNEIQAKLTSGQSVGYDMVTYYQGYSDMYVNDLKLLQPIDTNIVTNFADLYERFRTGQAWLKDGKVWGAPFTWGAEGCNYNADKIDPPQSWKDLLQPKFKGQVGMIDVMIDEIIHGGLILGYGDKLPNLTTAELAEVKKFLLDMKKQTRSIAASYGDLTDQLVSGEIVVTFPGWAAVNVWAQQRNTNVRITIPSEGTYSFCDALAVPVHADNEATAMAWINEALSPSVQACQAKALSAGVVNPKAVPLLDKDIAAMYDYAHLEDFFKKAPFYTMPPQKSDQYATYDQWTAAWEEVKAA